MVMARKRSRSSSSVRNEDHEMQTRHLRTFHIDREADAQWEIIRPIQEKLSYFTPKLAATLLVTVFLYITAVVSTKTNNDASELECSDTLKKRTPSNSDA